MKTPHMLITPQCGYGENASHDCLDLAPTVKTRYISAAAKTAKAKGWIIHDGEWICPNCKPLLFAQPD